MKVPRRCRAWGARRRVAGGRRVGGGCINEAWAVESRAASARSSRRARTPRGEYATEAAGLRWLAQADRSRVPAVLAFGDPTGRGAGARVDRRGRSTATARRRSGAAWPRSTPPARTPSARPARRAADGARAAPPRRARAPERPRATTGRRSTPSGACCRWWRGRARAGTLRAAGARAVERVCERIADLAGPARAARAPARRPVGRQRPGRRRRPRVADRPRRLRRPPRGRPGDAAAVRRSLGARLRRLRRGRAAGRRPRGARRRSGSCSRCSCTPCCSAAPTARRSSARPALRTYSG